MTGPGEPGDDGGGDDVDLDEVREPTTATDTVQDPIDWDENPKSDREIDAESRGSLDEVREPTTATDPVQESINPARREGGDDGSDGDESGAADGGLGGGA